MKQFFTLVVALICFAAMAQERSFYPNPNLESRKVNLPKHQPKSIYKSNKSSRAYSNSFEINYAVNDDLYADLTGGTPAGYRWNLNTNFPNDSFWTFRDATVLFDSLVENTDQFNSFKTKFYPKALAQTTVDLIYFTSIYENTTLSNDTFIFTVFKLPANFKYTTAQATANFGGLTTGTGVNEKWNLSALTAYKDTFISNGKDVGAIVCDSSSSGGTTIYSMCFEPNVVLAQGETFGFQVEFRGPIQNEFGMLAGYRDYCDTALAAQTIYPNSAAYLNWIQGANNYSGVYRDDFTFTGIPTTCNRFYIQNWRAGALVTTTMPFGAEITSAQKSGCPSSPIDLAANAFGSGEFTFDWSTSAGTLSSNTDETVTLTMPAAGDAIVTLITTDSLGTTKDTSTLTIKNNAIQVAVNSGNPVAINCGTTATVTAVPSGVFAGSKKYEWNIDADAQLDTTTTTSGQGKMGNLLPGNYSVTVTNTVGCTGTTTFQVEYLGGVTNTASFTTEDIIPGGSAQLCVNRPAVFTNTSANQTGWNASWSFGDPALSTSTDLSPTFTYTTVGNNTVTLTMDSAGCVFVAPSKNVQALASTANQCKNVGVNDVTFEQSVVLSPNPSTGLVNVNVSGAEKNVRINIVNVIGSEVYNFNTTDVTSSFSKQIDLSSLSNGTYLVKVQSAGKTTIKRLIVAK
jgi:hypothetical protein